MKRFFSVLLLGAAVLTGCSSTGSTPTTAPTPVPTNTQAAATATPAPTDTPAATSTPEPTPAFDITTLKDGKANACAKWDKGTLIDTAPIEAGSIIYANNMESSLGNYFANGNKFGDAEIKPYTQFAYTGSECLRIAKRKKTTHGISGAAIRLNDANGLNYASLVGHTLEISCSLYYADEGFSSSEELTFALYDTYRTEKRLDYVYNANNEIYYENGEPVMKEKDVYILASTCTVPRGEWTVCTFTITIEEATQESGCLLIGTTEETPNSLGMYMTYYLDDVTITVVK